MSRGQQVVVVTGRLSADPVVEAPAAGGLIARLSIPVDERYTSRSGEVVEHTEWLEVKLFGRQAEVAQQYLAKGHLVTVTGRQHTEKWQAQDGSPRSRTYIYAAARGGLTLLGGNEHTRTRDEHRGRHGAGGAAVAAQAVTSTTEVDDDIPF
jgi:single stranded DNA-binding protein (ssb)